MSGTFDDKGNIDPARGVMIFICGKKGSGKSIMGLMWARQYPGDLVVIDVAGDDGPLGEDVITIRGTVDELPRRWPEHQRIDGRRMVLRYVPDSGSPTFLEDMDAMVGLALTHGQCAVLVHETGVLAKANKTPPNVRRLLHHGRHNGATTSIWCGPRSQDIDPLVLQQADLVYVFELQGVNDRKRIAESIGWNTRDFDIAVHELGRHEYLRFDANEPKPAEGEEDFRLVHADALPEEIARSTLRWARGQSAPRAR